MSQPEDGGQRERTSFITLLALLNLLSGAVCLFLSLHLALESAHRERNSDLIVGAAALAIAALLLVATACGLWLLRPWGRILQLALAWSVVAAPLVAGLLISPPVAGLLLALMAALPVMVVAAYVLLSLHASGSRLLFSAGKAGMTRREKELRAPTESLERCHGKAWPSEPRMLLTLTVVAGLASIVIVMILPRVSGVKPRSPQKRSMSDLRRIGQAIETYSIDNGFPLEVPSSEDAHAVLAPLLEPTFIRKLPRYDGWRMRYRWRSSPPSYSIVSFGKDGVPDSGVSADPTDSPDADIIFSNGQFTRYPRGKQN